MSSHIYNCVLQLAYSVLHLFLSYSDCLQPSGCRLVFSTRRLFRHVHSATADKSVPKEERKETKRGSSDAVSASEPSHSLFPIKTFCQARTYRKERVRDEGKDGRSQRQRLTWWKNRKRGRWGCVGNWEWRQEVEKGKPYASPPAGRGERKSWLGADTGAQSVFIDLQDFNPQYWPKPPAEGWQPSQCRKRLITGGGAHKVL